MTTAASTVSKTSTAVLPMRFESTSDPTFQPIANATSFPNHVVSTIVSYLSEKPLPSTALEFINHFRTSDTLVIEAYRGFRLKDRTISWMIRNPKEAPYSKTSPLLQILEILRGLVAPLGKGLAFPLAKGATYSCSNLPEHEELFFSLDRDVILTVDSSVINCRISDLCYLMNLCSLSRLTFAKDQEIRIWGLSEEECRNATHFSKISRIFYSRALPGMDSEFSPTTGKATKIEPIYTDGGAYGLRLQGTGSFPLGFSGVRFHQYAPVDELLEYLAMFGEISLHANQGLTIVDDRNDLCRKAYPLLGEKLPFSTFVLDQALVHAGMAFEWISSDKASIQASAEGAQVFIRSTHPLILRPGIPEEIITTLELLSYALLSTNGGRESLVLRGGQQLHLFGLTQAEQMFFEEQCKRNQCRNLFPHPVGFVWSIRSSKEVTCAHQIYFRPSDTKEFPFLAIIPAEDEPQLELRLERATGEELVADLVAESHPQFLQELHSLGTAAMNFLVFRVLVHYCCFDFRFYRKQELPDLFSADTQEKILLLLRDETWTAEFAKIRNNLQLHNLMQKIWLEITAAEFDLLDKTQLPRSLQVIFQKISTLSSEESRAAPLLTRDLPNFLTKKTVPAAADKATAVHDSKDSKK